jgi:hypothetical protein
MMLGEVRICICVRMSVLGEFQALVALLCSQVVLFASLALNRS